ncbi:flagellar biosynthesis (GTP-binding) protein [Campylobacter pinnipediorum subsp. caledonicus]|uniref:Flagellar biosynthesis protein FlhF n=1 Tax=Campylobacter pinnipediorum subsp. caledonicus TaxID=1874362 RepID=A0A1S6U8B6_9BACT|nr:flagellar biosynthesis protein FlhF [Campylobacter pinnipediorum]AQW86335.1 flagellar biosynthesis (GTP-binding) protein [Campylobacter pinnipediorum subsp. caledonicus]AQW87988.1 flagellar biosynthesis (GTP-binding) protein [Campylobacter pinnipediorum subsp. caledonicus]OPA71433.1 flagellar biosynthesis protein FlhF [Campylobacter pinnipediorum subsp. caledonicus]
MATKMYSVTAESSIEALKKARELYGDNAIHVTTKQIQPKTINKKPIFEVVVSVEEADEIKQKPNPVVLNYENAYSKFNQKQEPAKPKFSITETKQEPVKQNKLNSEDVMLSISNMAKEISEIANIPAVEPTKKEQNQTNKKMDEVAKQVNILSEKVNLITDMFWDERAASRNNLAIPPEFATIYKAAKSSGMKEEHLEAIMHTTLTNMPTSMKANPTAVKRYFYSLLRNMLPCRKEKKHSKQRIMMLVGPTGVGKTTTLAKLAARFAYSSEKRYTTGIITLDTYRIGAVEQLFQYAKMMKLPILDVIEIDDFKDAIRRLNHCDIILVDTTGNSQYDKEKLDKLDKFLRASEAQIDVSLVLSAGSKVDDLIEIYNGFSFLDIDTLIITKFDETRVFGNVFSLIYETNTPVSYFCVGQEVPDDLIEAKSDFLVSCVLEGFKKDVL